MNSATFDILVNAEPRLSETGYEPCLHDLVLSYYRAHFSPDQAKQYRDEYFAGLKAHIGVAP